MRYSFISYLVLLFILIAGCATSHSVQENGPSENKSSFDTGKKMADLNFKKNSLLDPLRIKFQVSAECTGPDCTPDEAQLDFFVVPGPTKVVLRDLSLTLNAGQVIYQWNGPKWDYVEDAPVALGLLKSVTLDKKMLQQIAGNEDIFGDLGGQGFKWSYENREPIRELLADMQFSGAEN